MKISVAQTKPVAGDIPANIKKHLMLIQLAVQEKAKAIFFPELSVTGYEPTLAKELAMLPNDKRLEVFQVISDESRIVIGIGLPTIGSEGIHISMLIFQPRKPPVLYSKQLLHSDELPFFVPGKQQQVISIGDTIIAPGICYESTQRGHIQNVFDLGGQIYIATVAKSQNGVSGAMKHYADMAREFSMPIMMSNSIGWNDDFECGGNSSVWTRNGTLIEQLGSQDEGIVIFDSYTELAHGRLWVEHLKPI